MKTDDICKYLVYHIDKNCERVYVCGIYKDSIEKTNNYLNAIYFDTKDEALAMAIYCTSKDKYYGYKVLEIKSEIRTVEV